MANVMAATLVGLLVHGYAFAEDMQVPADVQAALFGKILTYDRSLKRHSNADYVIGVLYQPKLRSSSQAKDDFIGAMEDMNVQVGSFDVRCVPIMWNGLDSLGAELRKSGVNALYITPLRAVDIEELAGTCQAMDMLTMTGVADYLKHGIAVGIGRDAGRPEILIHLKASKAAGADFSSKLLKLARVIH